MPEMTLVEALNMALARAMDDDPNVVVFGEDVGVNGGVFRATVGLQQRFGSERVFDTPLAELLISGLCVGMAAQGLKPVGEIQLMGFIYPCIDQLVNHASRLRNRTQGRLSCPMVLRTRTGAAFALPNITPRAPRPCSPIFQVCASSCHRRRNALTACCSRRSATPIRLCSWNRRASTARRGARLKTTARPCRSTSLSFSGKVGTSR